MASSVQCLALPFVKKGGTTFFQPIIPAVKSVCSILCITEIPS